MNIEPHVMAKLPIPVTRPNDFEKYADAKKCRAERKSNLAFANLIRGLALAQKAREGRFATIVRLVRRREASGPAKDIMGQIRRDHQLCKLLVDYETESEIIGMTEFMRDLKKIAAKKARQ
jgi:hypothetical protein